MKVGEKSLYTRPVYAGVYFLAINFRLKISWAIFSLLKVPKIQGKIAFSTVLPFSHSLFHFFSAIMRRNQPLSLNTNLSQLILSQILICLNIFYFDVSPKFQLNLLTCIMHGLGFINICYIACKKGNFSQKILFINLRELLSKFLRDLKEKCHF